MEPLKKVGKYLFLEEQERTDLAAVWRAADLANGKIDHYYLADLISLKLTLDPGFLDHYLNQSLMVSKLEHPNILRKVKTTNESGALVSFYEYQEGFSLAAVLDRCLSDGFPFSIDHGLLVVSKLLSALAYAKSKHMTHGFVNPAVVFVTHEGEIKLKGFALSSSLRNCANGLPDLRSVFGKYVPPGKNITDDNRDLLDIFGCGAILFEMLTGESFLDQSGDPASIIANATTAALGESIPTQIANILISSLDPAAPTAYSDIQKMTKDMDELLFSGEYSPTTFNLAFFMHSAFRNEMDELNEKLGAEKEKDFSKVAAEAPAPAPAPAAAPSAPPLPTPPPIATTPPPPPGGYNEPPVQAPPVQAAPPADSGKSKMPLIIGAVAAVLVIGLGAFFALKPKSADPGSKFDKIAEDLEAERVKNAATEAAKREEELRIQNEQLKALIAEQQKAERDAKRRQLEEDMRKMDDEIARIKEQEEEAKRRKQLQAELDRLKTEREEAEAKRQAAREEAERQAQAEADAAAKREAAKKAAEAQAAAKETTTNTAPDTAVADAGTPTSAAEDTVEKPNPGDIVDLEVLLDAPVLLEPMEMLDVPGKAVRSGAVKKRGTVMFLMKLLINEEGEVEEAEIARNPIPGDDDYGMGDKAIRAAKRLRFSRPTYLEVPVKVWTYGAIHFQDK